MLLNLSQLSRNSVIFLRLGEKNAMPHQTDCHTVNRFFFLLKGIPHKICYTFPDVIFHLIL